MHEVFMKIDVDLQGFCKKKWKFNTYIERSLYQIGDQN